MPGYLWLMGFTLIALSAVLLVGQWYPFPVHSILIASIMGFFAPSIIAMIALFKIDQLHAALNSRLTELVHATEKAAELAGRASERAEMLASQPQDPPGPRDDR